MYEGQDSCIILIIKAENFVFLVKCLYVIHLQNMTSQSILWFILSHHIALHHLCIMHFVSVKYTISATHQWLTDHLFGSYFVVYLSA